MNIDSALELLRRGEPLAASLPPQEVGALAWAGVYPLDLTKRDTAPVLRRLGVVLKPEDRPVFRIRVIEVRESLVLADVWLSEDDLQSRADVIVVGEEALLSQLDRLGVPKGGLELHYKVNYPI